MKAYLIFALLSVCKLTSACIYDVPDHGAPANYDSHKLDPLYESYPECDENLKELMMALDLAAGPFSIDDVDGHSPWSNREHGADWPQNYDECGGSRQSPINIDSGSAVPANLPPLVFKDYTNYHPKMTIVNNGHTVDIGGPWGLVGKTVPTASGGPLKGTYQLYRVHFHWGYEADNFVTGGSEHTIDSEPGALEMHLVHFNSKYPNISVALAANDSESLFVVGIIFKPSLYTNRRARSIFTTLKQAVEGEIIFPALFPLDIVHQTGEYFTYEGSLTTPTCTEKVRWVVYENILEASVKHLSVFPKFKENGEPIEGNYRDPQPLNSRRILRAPYG